MSSLTLLIPNERHQICSQESKIHGCSHAICFLSMSFEKGSSDVLAASPQPLERGGGWESTCPGVLFSCAHQLDHCWFSWNLIYHPAQPRNAHLTDGYGLDCQGLPPCFLSKCTCPQPLKGAGTSSLGFFLTGMDVGEGVQEDWCETPSEEGGAWEPPHAKHFHTSLFNWHALGQQAACTACLNHMGSGGVCIALWDEDAGPALPRTTVFLPLLTVALSAGLPTWLPTAFPWSPKISLEFRHWARVKNYWELVRNTVGQQEESARWVKAAEEQGVVQGELQRK